VEPTQLVVVVQTDMIVPAELDGFVVRVRDGRGRLVEPERTFDLEGEGRVTLPATFGVAPRDRDPERRVTVEVDAMLDGARRFDTRARTGFVENEVLRLDLWLAGRCVVEGGTCSDEETCSLDGCVDLDVPPSDLHPWGGLDAGPPETDGGTGSVETGTEVLRGDQAVATDVVVGPDHAAYVTGSFIGQVDLDGAGGAGPSGPVGIYDAFVTKVGEDGVRAWTVTFGDEGSIVQGLRLAWSSTGTLLLSAGADRNATLCGASSTAALEVPVVLEIAPEDGACLGAEVAEPSGASSLGQSLGIVELEDGSRATAGWFQDGLSVGGVDLGGAGTHAFFVSRTDAGQTCSIVASGDATSQAWLLSPDRAGGLLLAGRFGPAGTTMTLAANVATARGANDGFFTGMDSSCTVGWVRNLEGELDFAGVEALDDGSGQILAVGTSRGLLTLGDVWLAGLGGRDVFAARMSRIPDPGADAFTLLGAGDDEEVFDATSYDGTAIVVAGRFSGTTNLHGNPLDSRGTSDGFVVALDAQFDARWVAIEAGDGADRVSAVAWDEGTGTVVAAGESTEGLWLGDTRLDPAPMGQLVFLHRFTPVEH